MQPFNRHLDSREDDPCNRRWRASVVIAAGLMTLAAGFPQTARAQLYKGKTITMIVNYPAGGPTDIEGADRRPTSAATHCRTTNDRREKRWRRLGPAWEQ